MVHNFFKVPLSTLAVCLSHEKRSGEDHDEKQRHTISSLAATHFSGWNHDSAGAIMIIKFRIQSHARMLR